MAMAPVARIHETTSKGLKLLSKSPNLLLSLAEKNGFFGKQHTEEQRKKKSAEKLAAPKIKCYHCNKEVDSMNYARWHGDKCKHKGE